MKKTPTKEPPKLTSRYLVERHRKLHRQRSWLARLTVEEFRKHLAEDLRGVMLDEDSWNENDRRLAEEDRSYFFELLQSVPREDLRFWQVLQRAEEQEELHPEDPGYCAESLAKNFFCKRFAQEYGEAAPVEWVSAAQMVFDVLRWIRDKARAELRITTRQSHKRWERKEESGLLSAVCRGQLEEKWVIQEISDLQKKRDTAPTQQERAQATALLKKVAAAMTAIGSGNTTTRSSQEDEEIVAACQKWRPICEGLNKEFKKLRKEPEWQSALYRKEARGLLAEKFSIPVADVVAIERYLEKPSRRAHKSTPTDAMCHRVAREFPGRGEKTIEKVWLDYLKNHPEESARGRKKNPTTSIDERIL